MAIEGFESIQKVLPVLKGKAAWIADSFGSTAGGDRGNGKIEGIPFEIIV